MAEYNVKFSLGGGFKSKAYDELLALVNSGILARSTEWAAEEILENARALCPVDSGRLRDSLYIKTTNTPEAAVHNDLQASHVDSDAVHRELSPLHSDIGAAQHKSLGEAVHFELNAMQRRGEAGSAGAFGVTKEVRSDLPYAMVVEFGNAHQAARPFLRPAIDMVRNRISYYHTQSIRKVYEEIVTGPITYV